MLQDTEYFKYIFKKTEKIVCTVFYIVRSDAHIGHTDAITTDLESSARALLDVSLESLTANQNTIDSYARTVQHALLHLESRLRIAHAAHIVGAEVLVVFMHEIDTVHRSLRKYTESPVHNPLLDLEVAGEKKTHAIREKRSPRASSGETGVTTEDVDAPPPLSRRERVLNVLRDKGESTIKDIVEVVKDCSEKTIQRELMSLIKDNVIARHGERRWSKYSLV